MTLSRRTLIAAGAAAAGASGLAMAQGRRSNAARFSLGFAPHEGSFASRGDRIEQIAYAADQGFTAWEDNEAAGRPVAEQEAMAKALRQRNMTMGVFVASMFALRGIAGGLHKRIGCGLVLPYVLRHLLELAQQPLLVRRVAVALPHVGHQARPVLDRQHPLASRGRRERPLGLYRARGQGQHRGDDRRSRHRRPLRPVRAAAS